MKKLIVLMALTSLPVYAQDKDYGDLVPNGYFSITQGKTTLKDNADISNFEIKVTPKQEEFTYKVNSVKTPRKGLLGKKSLFKLNVEKGEGKIERISSVNFSNGENGINLQQAQTSSVNEAGSLTSRTFCSDTYKINFLGLKKQSSGFKCVTVNPEVCGYIEKNGIEGEFAGKIKECSDLLGKLNKFQKDLFGISKKDLAKDMSALRKMNGNLSDAKNFYELEASTLNDVADISVGYANAVEQCAFLKQGQYFPESEGSEEPSHSGKPKPKANEQ